MKNQLCFHFFHDISIEFFWAIGFLIRASEEVSASYCSSLPTVNAMEIEIEPSRPTFSKTKIDKAFIAMQAPDIIQNFAIPLTAYLGCTNFDSR